MICKIRSCPIYKNNDNKDSDCILELLDFIKLHYFHSQTEQREKSSYISQLETGNLTLNKTIDNLRQEIQDMKKNFSLLKRRKVSQSEHADSTAQLAHDSFSHDPVEDLNIALTSDALFDETSDSLCSSSRINKIKSPKKEKNSPNKKLPLSPSNNAVNITPTKCYSKDKRNSTMKKLTPTKISQYLPKRIITKETVSGKRINIESEYKSVEPKKNLTTTAGWLSTEKNKKNGCTKVSANSALEFIQPVKCEKNDSSDNSFESIASSQNVAEPKQSMRKGARNILSFKPKPQMKQAKLEFDRQKNYLGSNIRIQDDKADEKMCDEVVCASPDVQSFSTVKDKTGLSQKSLRKFTRKNSDDELFNISIKKSTAFVSNNEVKSETRIQTSTPSFKNGGETFIKSEPLSNKKSYVVNLLTHLDDNKNNIDKPMISTDSIDNLSLESVGELVESEKNDDKNKNLTGSVMILPPKSDEVIIVDETENVDFGDIDSVDLFDEIMRKGSETPSVLKKIEKEQILKHKIYNWKPSIKPFDDVNKVVKLEISSELNEDDITQLDMVDKQCQRDLDNNKGKNEDENNSKIPITLQKLGHNCDCRNCNSYLRYLIELNLTPSEIKERLKCNTKHAERPLKLYLTPEGFWDPVMRDFPPNDPRNEVLIDYRLVDKENKNTKFKQNH